MRLDPPKAVVLGSHRAPLIDGFGRRADWKIPRMQTAADNILPRGFRDIYIPPLWGGGTFAGTPPCLCACVQYKLESRGKKSENLVSAKQDQMMADTILSFFSQQKQNTAHKSPFSNRHHRTADFHTHTHWSTAMYTRWPCCVTVQQSPWRCAWNSSDRLKLSGSPQVWSERKKKIL